MKHADSSLKMTVVLAFLAIFALSAGAETSTASNSVSAVQNAADRVTPVQLAPAPGPIHYYFDESPLDRTNHTVLSSYADMLDKVTPGVVGIYPSHKITPYANSSTRPYRGRGGNNVPQNLPPDMSWTSADSTAYRVLGVGSGCIISPDGYIITNHHVVADPSGPSTDGILVKLSDGREYEGKLIGSDESTDLALIKIDAKNLPVVKMADSEKIKVGDIVFAVGNPMDVGLTVTHGIVSATGRSKLDLIGDSRNPGFEDFIQTDAAINPGNSGGPLVDTEGRLVGLNAAIVSNSPDGGSIGIGFAIPSALVRHVADSLIKDGKVHRGALGVASDDITHNLAEALKLPNTHGAVITDFDPPNGPAAKSGLEHGDVIVKVNNEDVDSRAKLRYLVALADPGSMVNVTVLRDGQPKVFKIRLADRDELYPPDAQTTTATPGYGANPVIPGPTQAPAPRASGELLPGVSLLPLTADLRQQFGLPDSVATGLVVTDVSRNSPFFLQFGNGTTIILEVNRKPVSTLDELRAQLKPGDVNIFYIYHTDANGTNGHKAIVAQNLPADK